MILQHDHHNSFPGRRQSSSHGTCTGEYPVLDDEMLTGSGSFLRMPLLLMRQQINTTSSTTPQCACKGYSAHQGPIPPVLRPPQTAPGQPPNNSRPLPRQRHVVLQSVQYNHGNGSVAKWRLTAFRPAISVARPFSARPISFATSSSVRYALPSLPYCRARG